MVTFTSPMNRGLKGHQEFQGQLLVEVVTFTSPMNRGLKDETVEMLCTNSVSLHLLPR